MSNYTIYNQNSICRHLETPNSETLALNVMSDERYIEGYYDSERYYVKNWEIKEYPVKPDYFCRFNMETEVWDWIPEFSWEYLREERNKLLEKTVDPIVTNPLRWGSLTESQQTAYTTYRQELLDLPQNTEDPRYPVWPTPPE